MPRVKASPKKCVKSLDSHHPSNSWVFLMKEEVLEGDGCKGSGNTPDIIKLRHPQTGCGASFVISPGDGMLQEIMSFSEEKRSWFIDDSVQSDGKMHFSTPIDPVFLIIPYLHRQTNQLLPLDQLLKDEDFPETQRLLNAVGLKHLHQVADRKGAEDLNVYRFNEEKALRWLQRKTERVAEVLKSKGIHVAGGAVSATFVRSSKEDTAPEAYLRYAHGIISEYLPPDLSDKLLKHLGLPREDSPKKKISSSSGPGGVSHNGDAPATKRARSEPEDQLCNGALNLTKPEKASKAPTASSKEKARAKAALGSKSISAFFKKK